MTSYEAQVAPTERRRIARSHEWAKSSLQPGVERISARPFDANYDYSGWREHELLPPGVPSYAAQFRIPGA